MLFDATGKGTAGALAKEMNGFIMNLQDDW